MAFGYTLTVAAGEMPSSQGDFTWLAVTSNFPTASKDGGVSSILNGGGNLRAYVDDTKAVQLPVEIVTFITGGSPEIQVWGLSPNLNVASTIYIEADSVATTQPAFSASFGRDAVWVDFEAVLHMDETGTNGVFVDSTGNGHDSTLTTGSSLATTSGNPLGGSWPDFTQAEALTLANTYQSLNNTPMSMSCWMNAGLADNNDGLLGSRYSSPDNNWVSIQAAAKCITKGGSVENLADTSQSSGVTRLLKLKQNNTSLDNVIDGAITSQDLTVTSGESINNTTIANDFRVGTYFDNSMTRRYVGKIAEVRLKRSKDSVDLDTSEYNNQNDPSAFFTSSAWVDSGGGGISVTGATANYNYTGINGSIDLTGEIIVTGSTANYNYTGITGSIDLTGEVIVTGATANYNYDGIDGVVDLTALITVIGQTANYDYAGIAADVIIQGAIVVTGNTANYDYLGVNATIKLQGPIVVNPRNIIQAKRNSTTIRVKRNSTETIVKRNSNTIQVR